MGSDTKFNFGWNDPANNSDPWGRKSSNGSRSTEPDGNRKTCEYSGQYKDLCWCEKCLSENTENDSHSVSDPLVEMTCATVLKMVRNITATVRKGNRFEMDLAKYRNGSGTKTKFENRDWLTSEDLPKKGASKWKVDNVREAKKNSKGIIAYVDLTSGSKKRVMSLRKGFTLDAFMDELGTKTEKWNGKTISLERGGNEGQYVNVSQ